MSQNDLVIANQGFPAFRSDLNSALQALATNNSGTSAPSTTYANMWWYDSANNLLYIRNEDNDAWIKFAELDQTNDKFVLSGTLQLDDGTVSAPALTFNSDTNLGIYRGGTDILKFATAGTDAVTIDASQNAIFANDVQLKSDASVLSFGSDLDVTVTHDADDGLVFKSTATGDDNPFLLTLQTGETDLAADDVIGKIQFQAPDEGTGTDAILVSGAIQAVAEGDHSSSSNSTRLEFMTGASEAATTKASLTSGGRLGVGTTSPDGGIHVKGNGEHGIINIQPGGTSGSSNNNYLRFLQSNTDTNPGIELEAGASASTSMELAVKCRNSGSLNTHSTFKASGQLFIGTTSDLGGHTIQQKRTDAGGCLYLECNASSGSQSFLDIVNAANTGTSQGVRFHTNGYGNIRGTISWDNSSTSYNTSSDYRLKENVVTDWNATTRLKQLKPCRFNFISDADKTVDGFLAHEVSSIVPEAIVGEKDAVTDEVLYVNGDEIPEDKKVGDVKEASKIIPQQIDQSKLVPLLVKTIQELEARITTLESG